MKFLSLISTCILLTLCSCNADVWSGVLQGMAMASNSYFASTTTTPQYSNYNTSSYSTPSTSYSSASSSSSSYGSSSSTTTYTEVACGTCSGTGKIVKTDVPTFGLDKTKYCSDCGKNVGLDHYHATCPVCKGKKVERRRAR